MIFIYEKDITPVILVMPVFHRNPCYVFPWLFCKNVPYCLLVIIKKQETPITQFLKLSDFWK